MEKPGRFFFRYENINFFIEFEKGKRISLCRLLDTMRELFCLKQKEIYFEYMKQQIWSLETLYIKKEAIYVKRLEQANQNKICKFIFEISGSQESAWAVTSARNPCITNFLMSLSQDDEYKQIFLKEFQIFYKSKQISLNQPLDNFKNKSEFQIVYKIHQENIVKFQVMSFGYPSINIEFSQSTSFDTVRTQIILYYGFTPNSCKLFIGENHISDYNDINLVDLNGRTLDLVHIEGGANEDFKNKIYFNPNSPDYRQVVPGLNLKCICLNEELVVNGKMNQCKLFKEVFMVNFGYGKFNLNICREQIMCPGCGEKGVVRAFGIYKAKLEIYRKSKGTDSIWSDNYENYEDYYISFDCYLNKYKSVADIDFICSNIDDII